MVKIKVSETIHERALRFIGNKGTNWHTLTHWLTLRFGILAHPFRLNCVLRAWFRALFAAWQTATATRTSLRRAMCTPSCCVREAIGDNVSNVATINVTKVVVKQCLTFIINPFFGRQPRASEREQFPIVAADAIFFSSH